MKDINIAYKEILSKVIRQRGGVISPQDNPMQVSTDKKHEILYNDDLTCAIRLFESGYSVDDVIQALKKHSPMIRSLNNDVRAIQIYFDRVFENINNEWVHKADNSFAVAQDSYRVRMDALAKKYESYDKSNFGLYQDGEVALALVMKEGFTPEIVEEVIKRNSPNKAREDATYLSAIRDSISETQGRYKDILAQDGNKLDSGADVYRYQAKEYMKATDTPILSGADELKIIEKIYLTLIQKVQENRPEYQGDIKKLDEIMDSTVKPFLRKAIVEASPIYTEPGRDKNEYITSILSDFETDYESRKNRSSLQYPITQELFTDKVKSLQGKVTSYIKTHDQTFMDGLAAKELLASRQAPQNIIRAIVENSKVNLEKDTAFNDMKDYAQHVLEKADNSLHAEKEIMNFELDTEIPTGVPFRETGLTMGQMYQYMMRERLEKYPSFALEMTEPFADRDACEKLINRYPDYDRLDLKRAIQDLSPRAQLPGISPDYADEIIRQAEDRLRRVDEYQRKEASAQQEFNKLRGLSTEGVYDNDNPMTTYKDGRIAVKMLKKGSRRDDIKKYLVALAKASAIVGAFAYADKILKAASLVIAKENDIAEYASQDKNASARSCMDIYMEKMHDKYQQKGFIDPSMDISCMKEMLSETPFKAEQIKGIILSKSPVAQEPGRDDGYGDYVIKQALLEREKEQERLNRYVITPRVTLNSASDFDAPSLDAPVRTKEAEKPSCKEEYEYQREKMEKDLNMDWSKQMELMLAGALLTAGYEKDEIEDTLNDFIPDYYPLESAVSYGQSILQEVVETTEKTETISLDNAMVLERTISTTTTITESVTDD